MYAISPVNGLQDTNATGIQIKFPYPNNAHSSNKFAPSLPNHLNTPHKPNGINAVYP